MAFKIGVSKINLSNCDKVMDTLFGSEEYFHICFELSGLGEINTNRELAHLMCIALGVSIHSDNISKITKTYFKNKVIYFKFLNFSILI